MATKTVRVPALRGAGDAADLERELGGLEGVCAVAVDRAAGRVTIEWTEAGISWHAVRGFLEEIGDPPAGEHGDG
jgi:copper chaperone CopZ